MTHKNIRKKVFVREYSTDSRVSKIKISLVLYMGITAGFLISDTTTKNQFAKKPRGLRTIRDHRSKRLKKTHPTGCGNKTQKNLEIFFLTSLKMNLKLVTTVIFMRFSVAIIAAVSDFLYLARIFGKLILFIQLLKSILETILKTTLHKTSNFQCIFEHTYCHHQPKCSKLQIITNSTFVFDRFSKEFSEMYRHELVLRSVRFRSVLFGFVAMKVHLKHV